MPHCGNQQALTGMQFLRTQKATCAIPPSAGE